jgi:type IX secretion system PorP/SprF family membrane protein
MKSLKLTLKSAALGILAFGFAGINDAKAQQDALFSQYMFNTLAINPAYAGSRDVLSATAMYRDQWGGLEGAPKTLSATVDMPFSKERMGIGLQAFNDVIGVTQNTGAYFSYAYRVKLSPKTTLALGAQVGVFNFRNALSLVKNVGTSDQIFSTANDFNKILPNVGAGIYISNDKSYLGLSAPTLLEHSISSKGTAKIRRHYFAQMGFVVPMGNSLKLKPSMQFKYVAGAPLSFDGNLNLWIKDKVGIGTSARFSQVNGLGQRLGDMVLGMLEVQLTPQLRFGYAYDFTMNSLNSPEKSGKSKLLGLPTHEGMLRYEFGYGRNKILTPRYF